MGKHHIILVAFFAVVGLPGNDFHGHRRKEIPFTAEERQSICPSNEKEKHYNYDCTVSCQNISSHATQGFILKQQDFTVCGTTGQCINGKCFQGACVDKCKSLATQIGKTLTNIRVDETKNIVYCYAYDGVIYAGGFSNDVPCEMPNQLDFNGGNKNEERIYNDDSEDGYTPEDVTPEYGYTPEDVTPEDGDTTENDEELKPDTHLKPDDGLSDVNLSDVVQPDQECKKIFRHDAVSARLWNNGCYFRCVVNGNIRTRRYLQPTGATCAANSVCLNSKCQKNICIDRCQAASNRDQLKDITQEDKKSDQAFCSFEGKITIYTVTLRSALRCEASYPDDESADGGGKPVNGNTIFTFQNISGVVNFGNTNSNNNNLNGKDLNPQSDIGKNNYNNSSNFNNSNNTYINNNSTIGNISSFDGNIG